MTKRFIIYLESHDSRGTSVCSRLPRLPSGKKVVVSSPTGKLNAIRDPATKMGSSSVMILYENGVASTGAIWDSRSALWWISSHQDVSFCTLQ